MSGLSLGDRETRMETRLIRIKPQTKARLEGLGRQLNLKTPTLTELLINSTPSIIHTEIHKGRNGKSMKIVWEQMFRLR